MTTIYPARGPIEAAIRVALGIPYAEITAVDLARVTRLNLSGTNVTEITPLPALPNLAGLDLSNTGVADLSPLAGLDTLEVLWLRGTAGADLSPLDALVERGLKIYT